MSRTRVPALITGLLAASLLVAAPATAGDDDDRERIQEGSCSAAADWKLKAKSDDGRIEVEGEVDSNQSGQSWTWRIVDNGTVAARGTATTRGRSGSFSVERKIADASGTDRLVFRASNGASGETCRGLLSF